MCVRCCKLRSAEMPKKAGNAVNEFDDAAWNAAFSQMTEDRKEDDKGSIATKDAMAVVDKLFDDMRTRYFGHLDEMQSAVDTFSTVSSLAHRFTHLDLSGGTGARGFCSKLQSGVRVLFACVRLCRTWGRWMNS